MMIELLYTIDEHAYAVTLIVGTSGGEREIEGEMEITCKLTPPQ